MRAYLRQNLKVCVLYTTRSPYSGQVNLCPGIQHNLILEVCGLHIPESKRVGSAIRFVCSEILDWFVLKLLAF